MRKLNVASPTGGLRTGAGIDGRPPAGSRSLANAPRTRGDEPWEAAGVLIIKKTPPHTRGGTGVGAVDVRRGRGLPEHAGLDHLCEWR